MNYELKSVGYWPVVKISFIINLIVGFIIGIFYGLFIGLIFGMMNQLGGMPGMPPELANDPPPTLIMVIIMPFLFSFSMAFFNTIIALIVTFVYNLTAKLLGGLEFDLAPKDDSVRISQPEPVQRAEYIPTPPPPPVEPFPDDIKPTEGPNDGDKV